MSWLTGRFFLFRTFMGGCIFSSHSLEGSIQEPQKFSCSACLLFLDTNVWVLSCSLEKMEGDKAFLFTQRTFYPWAGCSFYSFPFLSFHRFGLL
jgi:hypothetical protein